MNKVPRFVKEYANYQKRQIDANTFMHVGKREELKCKVVVSEQSLKRGLITVSECMKMIADVY